MGQGYFYQEPDTKSGQFSLAIKIIMGIPRGNISEDSQQNVMQNSLWMSLY